MIRTNFYQDSEVKKVTNKVGKFSVIEYQKDVSVTPERAMLEYFAGEMNVRKRQLAIELNGNGVILQAGAMQWMAGPIEASTNIKGVGDLAKKFLGATVTKESTIKPRYTGNGTLVLEPTYKHLILMDMDNWQEGLVIEDGLFLACDDSVNIRTVARTNLSSAVLGNEGLFNTMLQGKGTVCLESNIPYQELVLIELDNDVVKIDGSYAIAWSNSLQFTVERTTKTLVGSAASGEGLVNVYRGSGKILMAPIA